MISPPLAVFPPSLLVGKFSAPDRRIHAILERMNAASVLVPPPAAF